MERDHVADLAEQWAQQRPELGTAALEVAARVFRLQRILSRSAAARLTEVDLNEGEFSVLAALRRSGPPFELTPTELHRSLLLSSGAMTHRVDRLERAGHVTRIPDADDRRRVRVRLTASGREVVDRAITAYTDELTCLLAVLDDEERDGLSMRLRTLLGRLEGTTAPPRPPHRQRRGDDRSG
jgi:DNA-binding MarR family transcriptional regulator